MSQKTALFIVTAVETSNLTKFSFAGREVATAITMAVSIYGYSITVLRPVEAHRPSGETYSEELQETEINQARHENKEGSK
jgi:hypothetical protein